MRISPEELRALAHSELDKLADSTETAEDFFLALADFRPHLSVIINETTEN